MKCGHEQTIEVLRAEIVRLEHERADLLAVVRDCHTSIMQTPRSQVDWKAIGERCRAAVAYHDEERA